MIYLTSDLHLGHDKDFIFKTRGFANIKDHNTAIVNNWNNLITDEDEVYVLGDLMLGNVENGTELIKSLHGKIHIILGNHDRDARLVAYNTCSNIVSIEYATIIKYKNWQFFLSHYPAHTITVERKHICDCLINLYGHTHQKTNFFNDSPFMYHVGVDSHNNTPVSLDTIIEDCLKKYDECIKML